MKYIYKILASLLVIGGIFSCSDDADVNFKIQDPEATFSIAAPLGGTTIVLDSTNVDNQALTLIWEDSKNDEQSIINYNIEFAINDTDFASPINAGSTDATNYSWTVEELNTLVLNELKIPDSESSTIDVRIVTSNQEVSESIVLIIVPHIVEVKALFVNGTFTSWDPTQGIAMNSTEFNKFTATFDIADGDEFNFIESNTSDDVAWQLVEIGSENLTKFGGTNLSGYPAGKYEINVDLTTKTFTIVEIVFPEALFLLGAAVPDAGWGWDSPVEMILTQVDVFEVTTTLANDAFRFFTVKDDWGSGLNHTSFINEGYTIDANFEDALDGDNNFRFIGTPGLYAITVNGIDKTITIAEVVASSRIAVPGNHQGWDPGSAPQLEASSSTATDYEGYVWLDGEHKFVGPDNNGDFAWGNTDWGDDGSFAGLLLVDGEVNCVATTAGHYYIQADTNALTYTETMYNWGLIGDATPDGWDSDQDLTYDPSTSTWSITLDLVVGQIKFRANDAWDWNYGDTGADGSLENGGDNMVINTAGNYTIVLDLSTPRAYTYSITLN